VKDPNFSGAFNGISYLLNFLFLGALFGVIYFLYEQLKQCDLSDEGSHTLAARALGNMTFDLKSSDSVFVKYYHLITFGKKLIYSGFIVLGASMNENQVLGVIIVEGIFFVFMLVI
jgi:hypothetical protein